MSNKFFSVVCHDTSDKDVKFSRSPRTLRPVKDRYVTLVVLVKGQATGNYLDHKTIDELVWVWDVNMAEDFEFQLLAQKQYEETGAGEISYTGETCVDPNDGSIYEWDVKRKGWFPKVL